jgi:catechol 2,3-dioxygenase-like lactoylglutathione lyase family enzyme
MGSDRVEMKFELVPVPVEDIDRAKEFYVEKLGLRRGCRR